MYYQQSDTNSLYSGNWNVQTKCIRYFRRRDSSHSSSVAFRYVSRPNSMSWNLLLLSDVSTDGMMCLMGVHVLTSRNVSNVGSRGTLVVMPYPGARWGGITLQRSRWAMTVYQMGNLQCPTLSVMFLFRMGLSRALGFGEIATRWIHFEAVHSAGSKGWVEEWSLSSVCMPHWQRGLPLI